MGSGRSGRTSPKAAGRDRGEKNIKSAATPPTANPIFNKRPQPHPFKTNFKIEYRGWSIVTEPGTEGQTVITESGEQYFIMGKNRIKITEHFPPSGKQLDELVTDLIIQKIKENSGKSA